MQLAHIDPSVVGQPSISVEKLHSMWREAVRAWNRSKTNFEASGSNSEFWDFCGGELVCQEPYAKGTLMIARIF